MTTGLRWGLFLPQGWRHDLIGIEPAEHWGLLNGIAQHADIGGWDSIWVYDHFHTTPVPTQEATHEAWTLIAAMAATTKRVRLGQMCTCMGYRNPAYLAKIAATCDIISGGRVEMGIGAGWYEPEWRAYGYGYPSDGERLKQLDEGVRILRQAWTGGVATLNGSYYQVHNAIVRPLPLQPGGIPLWIAGGGEKVTLKIAAKYAQYTNFDSTLEVFDHKSKVLAEHCRTVGTDFDAITRSANFNVAIGETEAEVEDRLRRTTDRVASVIGEKPAQEWISSLFRGKPTVGTVDQVIERLAALRDRGMGYAILYFPEIAYDRSGLELFERRVIPALT